MKYTVAFYIDWEDEKYFEGDKAGLLYEDLLRKSTICILNWLNKNINDRKFNITNIVLYNVYCGNAGVGDAYTSGGYQAVDIDCPSSIYFDMESDSYSDMKQLVNIANKELPDIYHKETMLTMYCDASWPSVNILEF